MIRRDSKFPFAFSIFACGLFSCAFNAAFAFFDEHVHPYLVAGLFVLFAPLVVVGTVFLAYFTRNRIESNLTGLALVYLGVFLSILSALLLADNLLRLF